MSLNVACHSNVEVWGGRIFNPYEPRMFENDGRMVSNFALQALKNSLLTVYGDGSQTLSIWYVSDLVEGLIRLIEGIGWDR